MSKKEIMPKKWFWGSLAALLISVGGIAQTVQWNIEPGYYEQPQELVMMSQTTTADVYYSVDGSDPLDGGQLYQEPLPLDFTDGNPDIFSLIPTNNLSAGHPYRENWRPPQGPVQKIHVIRAIAVMPNGDRGEEKTGTFIIHPVGLDRYTLPVVSLITESDNFFGHEAGIYVPGATGANYSQRGREWERPVFVEFFDESGERVIGQRAGARIHGGTSRNRPRKTLRLYARSDYGLSWFNYPVFPEKAVGRYKRLLLRNSGNDWSESIFRDAFLQSLVSGFSSLDIQYSRPSVVFINGEYWGIHNIRDRFDARYLESHYGLDPGKVSILEGSGNHDHGSEEGVEDYNDLIQFVAGADITQESVFRQVSLMMDMSNFIDYQILQIYSRNTDWPGNNVAFWKYMDGEPVVDSYRPDDGRWRWLVFDLDFGFGLDFDYVLNSGNRYGGNDAFHNTLAFALEPDGPPWPNPAWSTLLFRKLMQSDKFKFLFVNRFADHLNTVFSAEYCLSVLLEYSEIYGPEMQEHIERWNEPTWTHWEDDLENMRVFGQLRAPIMRNHLNNTLGPGGTGKVVLDVGGETGGNIQVNSVLLSASTPGVANPVYPWDGIYFQSVPIRIEALPKPGFQFSHWSGDLESSNSTVEFLPDNSMHIVAHFNRAGDFEGDSMNPGAHPLFDGPYHFSYWSPEEPGGSFPPNMVFQQSGKNDPLLPDEMTAPYHIPYNSPSDNEYHSNDQDKIGFPYSLTGRTRINGLNERGISFINTGRGRDLGAAVLALNTERVDRVLIDWEAGTEMANSRVYHLRLQYRTGLNEVWRDLTDTEGRIVEYIRQYNGLSQVFEELELPQDAMGLPYVQLRWKYYFTGTRLTQESGQRDELRLGNVYVRAFTSSTSQDNSGKNFKVLSVIPNPTSGEVQLEIGGLPGTKLEIDLLESTGRFIKRVFDGFLEEESGGLKFYLGDQIPGMYYLRFRSDGGVQTVRRVFISR